VVTFHIITEGGKNIMAYLRKHAYYEVLVFLNLGASNVGLTIQDQLINAAYTNVFNGTEILLAPGTLLNMHSWEYLVFERKVNQ